MSETCKERVASVGDWHSHTCSRGVWKDGYCKQHHPDTVKARSDKCNAAYKAKWAKKQAEWDNERASMAFDTPRNRAIVEMHGELVEALKTAREAVASIPRSFGYQVTLSPVIERAIQKAGAL